MVGSECILFAGLGSDPAAIADSPADQRTCDDGLMDKAAVERFAIEHVIRYLKRRGFEVTNVTRTRGHNGYDLLATRGDETVRIEVKGCTRPWGIPDPYVTEFDEHRRLVADYLYVVYFLGDSPPRLCVIPREALKPEMIRPKYGWKISSRFKKESVMARFIVADDDDIEAPRAGREEPRHEDE